jgi:hypothetical protein
MDIPVFIEHTPTGTRASTGAPFNLVAEGSTYDLAIANLRQQILAMQNSGRLVTLKIDDPDPLLARVAALAADTEFMEQWAQAVREVREESAAAEEQDAEVEAELNGHGSPTGEVARPASH